MRLETADVRAKLKAPASAGQVAACVRHEERLRLHAVPCVDELDPPAGLKRLLERWAVRLPKDKYERLVQHLEWPLPTTEIAETVFDGLARVYEAQDGLIQCELASPELETDFEQYRTQQQEQRFWRTEVFQAICTAPHSLLVVDMAAEQATLYPEPYTFLLDISAVIDVELKPDGTCEYLLYAIAPRREGSKTIRRAVALDDAFYRVLEQPDGQTEWAQVLENPHVLGYCPARLLWSEPLAGATALPRRGPLTAQLGQLDRFVWWDAAVEYYRTYGTFPIIWSFEEECDFQTLEGDKCQGGVVQFVKGTQLIADREVPVTGTKPCPACETRKLIGPGTHLKVPAPTKDTPDTRNPAGTVEVDIEALRHVKDLLDERKRQIVAACLGTDNEPQNAQAKNQDQVQAGFESKQDVLVAVKRNLEAAHQWDLQTRGILRYGERFRSAFVSYGEQFYLKSPEELAAQEESAKKAGRPVYELSQAREFRYDTQYRGNPALRDRMRILSDLEPYPEYSLEQIGELLSKAGQNPVLGSLFDAALLKLKADFGRYLTRFESEQADVRLFASQLPYHLKIDRITQVLLSYVSGNQVGQQGQGNQQGA